MTIPVSQQTLSGALLYQVISNATVGVLVGVTAAQRLTAAAGSTITFGTDPTTGSETISYTALTGGQVVQDIQTSSDSQSPTAFTYVNGGTTYIVSNVALTGPIADVTVGTLTALTGGLGDVGLTSGSNAYIACYLPGTLIATPHGDVAIDSLRIDDMVLTLSGEARPIRWIGRRSYAGAFVHGNKDVLPVCIRAGALGDDVPRRDLQVSPRHAMLLNGVLIPARMLVNGISITQAEEVEEVHYIHIELEHHAAIWAEGALSETFVDDNSRGLFQNAHEFDVLYPGRVRVPAVYCAPRVEDGDALAAAKMMVDTRAGLFRHAPRAELRGRIDEVLGGCITGWAQDPGRPEAPVCLDLLLDGKVIGRTLANLFRNDLRAAGMGSGRHAFRVVLPGDARSEVRGQGRLEVCRSANGATLGTVPLEALTAEPIAA